ncbi:isoprenylcysteine carboxylmethyltransferase family protein [Leptolyngbya cf. ectocarpi LEGE 11479]|uniref:Isoprenylcysteine carboxylmethyltransferase family protein n=1 Tax=Leptolyngbya cf. ectocarpi LEGE 11479 TaxID=1828722 RepID=A0A928ZTX8_LEPEC|nr:isoprenylcysteine carboxylmethyltransferase family protein [Leptolyngbya ectocarpi]MBE9067396.1 isoprenylcysteine carboxylmethyltransferase family protein [Leptolyngbya cf. ectocarpi LEGE 11479]
MAQTPELMKQRGQFGEGTKTWDMVLLTVFGLTFLAIPIVAALDIRHQWSEMPLWLWPLGAVLYAGFVAVIMWSMAVNPHFEKTVRIQRDRNHHVIDTGPYGIVRHPGYAAIIFGLVLVMPLLLGSWWAFIPAILTTLCLVLRTALEDRTLYQELSGYKDYTRKVRYRLLPGLW